MISHPQVPGQCERFLRGELAHARILAAASTAEAVRTVLDGGRRGQAALGTELAARIYGGTVIRKGIQDRDDNETRFIWLARGGEGAARSSPPLRAPPGERWRTSIVFWGAGAERPGWLVRCLDEFARRDINLTKIESRPRRERLGSYMFFADLTGRAEETPVADAIAGMGALSAEVRLLGSYRLPPRHVGTRRRRAAPRFKNLPRHLTTAPRRPATLRREDGKHSPTRAGGVRVALRAPAARTWRIAYCGDGRSGARLERHV